MRIARGGFVPGPCLLVLHPLLRQGILTVTTDRVVNPWEIARALLPDRAGVLPVEHRIAASTPALELRAMADDIVQPAETILDLLFTPPANDHRPQNVYALLDASRSQFLPTRLETSGLAFHCLYDLSDDPALGETAPWLVQLDRDATFSRATLAHDPISHDPRKMLGDGIFLVSPLSLDDMRRHLRRYTVLRDEVGVQQYFRLQEPGMLDALLCVATDPQRAAFFSGARLMVYPRPALETDTWDFVSASLPGAEPVQAAPVPVVDAAARKALTIFVNDRNARLLAVADIPDPSERPAASWTFSRLMNAGFDHPPRLVEAFRLLQRCPPDAHPSFWQQVESGQYSLRPILLTYATHYHIKGIFEDVKS